MSVTVADLPGRWTYLYKPQMKLQTINGGYESTLAFETDFSNLGSFVSTIAGTSQTITTTWGSMNRVVTLQHPIFSGLYAIDIDTEAFGAASESSQLITDLWSHAKVVVKFRSVNYGITGDQAYMTIEEDSGSEYTTIPGRKFAFPDGQPIDQEAGRFSAVKNYILSLYQCPDQNSSSTDALMGKVNSVAFLDWPAGQLLFGRIRSTQSRSMGGVLQFQKQMTLAYREYPWNQSYKRDGTLDTPVDPAGNPQYAEADFYTAMG